MIKLNLQLFAGVSLTTKKKTQKAQKQADKAITKYGKWVNEGFNLSNDANSYKTNRDYYSDKFASGQTQYTTQKNEALNAYLNRDPFSYDADSDAMFQQYLSSAMKSGKTAMQDTMGQAAALTGGYGSSYATSSAAQAYNAYVQEAYDNLPQYYQMALDRYNMEGQEMYNKYNMLFDADQAELSHYYDTANMYGQMFDSAWNQEFNLWGAQGDAYYNNAVLKQGRADSLAGQYWQGKNYDLSVDQFNKTLNKSSSSGSGSSSDKGSGTKEWALTDEQYTRIQNIFISNGGGDKGKQAVVDYLTAINNMPGAEYYGTLDRILDAVDGEVIKINSYFNRFG